MNLSQQKCIPCEGGMPPLTQEQAKIHLEQIPQWKLKENNIERNFVFKNFMEAMEFINKVAQIAEKEGHHPDITISYNKVHISLTTHAISGLSVNDFIIASKINTL
ncbi:MAG: hypothetical protein RJA61_539 [Candidatus Parcubacteria bacterium]|jgi:4a-hydroxytetrahydrobiopterin dehydratase